MNRNVILLAFAQAMLMTGMSLILSSSALVGMQLAPDPAWATLPLSLQFLTTMLILWPVAQLMQRFGRRPIFIAAALIGAAGFALAAFGIYRHSFAAFALAGLLIGVINATGQYYRFAAAESVAHDFRSRAISFTLAGGVLAAFIGPNLARLTRDALSPAFFASFLALIGTSLFAAALLTRLRLPRPTSDTGTGEKRRLVVIARQPTFIVAVLAGTIGYGAMNLLMTATPLAMHAHHHSFAATAEVIQWHVVAMFAPSFVTGDLIRRFGIYPILLGGCALIFAAATTNLLGAQVFHFETALILMGVGWNFLYVGGTTLLTETYRPAERAMVQAFNDTLVFTTVTISSLVSAALVAHFGWGTINMVTLPILSLVTIGIGWLRWRSTAQARAIARG